MGASESRIPDRRCVCTTLVGNYERLNEQPMAIGSDVPFVCFTDDPSLRSKTWEIRQISCVLERDPIRSQREIKLSPHKYLPDFDASLYIDNNVLLLEPPVAVFERYFPASGLALPGHSFRQSVADEFVAVYDLGLDEHGKIVEQLDHYLSSWPGVLDAKPFWSGIQLRDHRSERARAVLELWLSHVLRYSRRDQLSINFVAHELGFEPDRIEVNNHKSWFHAWALESGRVGPKRGTSALSVLSPLAPLIDRIGTMEQELRELRRALKIATRAREGSRLRRRLARLAASLKHGASAKNARSELGAMNAAAKQ
jgi:hypothetical protein